MPYFSDRGVFSALSDKKKKVLTPPRGLPIFDAMDCYLQSLVCNDFML